MHLADDQPGSSPHETAVGASVAGNPHARQQSFASRIRSLFSGYGDLGLAAEHTFNAQIVWFSEINEPIARLFAHRWPHALNLGDITAIDCHGVDPVDILIGGFPRQDVNTVGKPAGLKLGTHSGGRTWPKPSTPSSPSGSSSGTSADCSQQPQPDPQRKETAMTNVTPADTTLRDLGLGPWHLTDGAARLLRAMGVALGDLADLWMDARWVGIPAADVGAPHHRLRVFTLAHRAFPPS